MTSSTRRGMVLGRGERLALFGGVAAAVVLALSAHVPGSATAQSSGAPAASSLRLATADVLGLTDRLMATDKYTSAHQTQVQTLNRALEPLQAELQALATRYQSLATDSPERGEIERVFNAKNQQLQNETQAALRQMEIFRSTQAADAYRLVVEQSDRIARESGYSHLIATRAQNVVIRSDTMAGAIQEMLARPIVRGAESDDLTERIAAALQLPAAARAVPAPGEGGGSR